MAITSVTIKLNNQTTTLTYNSETGYYEATLTAPNIPSALTEDKFYDMTLTAVANDADTKRWTASDDIRLALIVVPDFIYDRTQSDVNLVKELDEKYQAGTITAEEIEVWNADLKGALNLSDLKRNEFNLYCISEQLDLGLTTKYNVNNDSYSIPDLPKVAYYAELLANVTSVYNSGRHYTSTPSVPAQPLNVYQKWNDIEQILHDAFYISESEGDGVMHAGEIYAGDTISIL